MASDKLNSDRALRPPFVAQLLLALSAGSIDRIPILGDLQEDYARRFDRLSACARVWYWREVFRTAPRLVVMRVNNQNLRTSAMSVVLSLAALAAIAFWDIFVARNMVAAMTGNERDASLFLAETMHLVLQMAGVTLSAGGLAYFSFRDDQSFGSNFRKKIGLLAFLLFAPTIASYLIFAAQYSIAERIIWLGLTGASLSFGAKLGSIARKRITK